MEIKMDAWMRWNGQGMTVLSNEINYVAVKKKCQSIHKQEGSTCTVRGSTMRSALEIFGPQMDHPQSVH